MLPYLLSSNYEGLYRLPALECYFDLLQIKSVIFILISAFSLFKYAKSFVSKTDI